MALGSVSIHSCWASSKVYHSFIFIWWKNALSFVCLDIDISIHFVLSLSMFTIEALVFSFVLVSYVIRDVLFYFIFNTHGCIQRIYISSLSARMEEFFFYDYSYFARPNFGMMCMPASSIVVEVVYFQRVMVSI